MMRERKSSIEPNEDLLNQPCPYHSTSGESVRAPRRTSLPKLSSIFEKFRYSRVSQQSAKERENKDDESSTQPRGASFKTANTREKWLMPIFLLLLIPSLLNLFLVFNGPVVVKGDHHATNHQGAQGGKDVTSTSSGPISTTPMYTIAQTAYRQRLQGGSYAVVYTDENGADGKIRVAGIGVFHQLHCLNGSRSVIQQLQASKRIGYSVFTDVSEHRATGPTASTTFAQSFCAIDDTVETSSIDGGQWSLSGYDTPRLCKDYKGLYDITACRERGCEGQKY